MGNYKCWEEIRFCATTKVSIRTVLQSSSRFDSSLPMAHDTHHKAVHKISNFGSFINKMQTLTKSQCYLLYKTGTWQNLWGWHTNTSATKQYFAYSSTWFGWRNDVPHEKLDFQWQEILTVSPEYLVNQYRLLQTKRTPYLLITDSMSLSWFCSTRNCVDKHNPQYHITSIIYY